MRAKDAMMRGLIIQNPSLCRAGTGRHAPTRKTADCRQPPHETTATVPRGTAHSVYHRVKHIVVAMCNNKLPCAISAAPFDADISQTAPSTTIYRQDVDRVRSRLCFKRRDSQRARETTCRGRPDCLCGARNGRNDALRHARFRATIASPPPGGKAPGVGGLHHTTRRLL